MQSNLLAPLLLSIVSQDFLANSQRPLQHLEQTRQQLADLIRAFLANPLSPFAFFQFERELQRILRETGRDILQTVVNSIEPELASQLPKNIFDDESLGFSRKNQKTNNREGIGSLFGVIWLRRFSYEPLTEAKDQQRKSFSPLEALLGIVARNATPALAERTARDAASMTQSELADALHRDHDIHWSFETQREVTAEISGNIDQHLHDVQKERLLEMFAQADKSSGPHPLTLSVGRDGIMLPMRNEESYKEGSVGTVTVMDRNGRRVGTVYLGQMPESLQPTTTADLTRMVTDVLAEWSGELPRLVYVTDAGHHQTGYFETLCGLAHPRRPGETLSWQWVVDYFHACEYVTKLSKLLFTDERSRLSWSGKMRRWLKLKPNAVFRILHSAAKYHRERTLTKTEEKEYRAAYQYLLNHREWMEYSSDRSVGLPIGSGVTEAGCKIVFTQRFKCSGMRWSHAGGTSILRLRLAKLSGVWDRVYERTLECPVLVAGGTKTASQAPAPRIAA